MKRSSAKVALSPDEKAVTIYMKAESESWSLRTIVLNVVTGELTEYIEKNGRRNYKSQMIVKDCNVYNSNAASCGKDLSLFLLFNDGKIIYFAFDTSKLMNEWKNYFKSICSPNEIEDSNITNQFIVSDNENINQTLESNNQTSQSITSEILKPSTISSTNITNQNIITSTSNNLVIDTNNQSIIEETPKHLSKRLSFRELSKQRSLSNEDLNANINSSTITQIVSDTPIDSSDNDNNQEHISIQIHSILHPAYRLSRRVQLWNLSNRFTFKDFNDINTFINELRISNDIPLVYLSYSSHEIFLDWIETINILKQQEYKQFQAKYGDQFLSTINDMTIIRDDSENIQLIIVVTFLVGNEEMHSQAFQIDSKDTINTIANKISDETGVDKDFLITQIRSQLSDNNNYLQQGYDLMKAELLYAEDLFIFQEEIISRLSADLEEIRLLQQQSESQQQLLDQENTSTNLSNEIKSSLNSNMSSSKLLQPLTNTIKSNESISNNPTTTSNNNTNINREDWKQWMAEKHQLILSHNEEKSSLISELRLLRQSLNPKTEKTFLELKNLNILKNNIENNFIESEMKKEQLQNELKAAYEKIELLEYEKYVISKSTNEQIQELKNNIDKLKTEQLYVSNRLDSPNTTDNDVGLDLSSNETKTESNDKGNKGVITKNDISIRPFLKKSIISSDSISSLGSHIINNNIDHIINQITSQSSNLLNDQLTNPVTNQSNNYTSNHIINKSSNSDLSNHLSNDLIKSDNEDYFENIPYLSLSSNSHPQRLVSTSLSNYLSNKVVNKTDNNLTSDVDSHYSNQMTNQPNYAMDYLDKYQSRQQLYTNITNYRVRSDHPLRQALKAELMNSNRPTDKLKSNNDNENKDKGIDRFMQYTSSAKLKTKQVNEELRKSKKTNQSWK